MQNLRDQYRGDQGNCGQMRLRDLGGIIVIDFIDMDERKNRQKVMVALEKAMRVDRAPYKIPPV